MIELYYQLTFAFTLWFYLDKVPCHEGHSVIDNLAGSILAAMVTCFFIWPVLVYRLIRPLR